MKKIITFITDNFTLSGALFAVYFFIIYKFFDINLEDLKNMEIKDIGGFLGGIFSPLAFLMLIIGYIKEHKNSEFTKKWLIQERISHKLSIQPDFNFRSVGFNYSGESFTNNTFSSTHVYDKELLHLDIQNIGEEATRIKLMINNKIYHELPILKKEEVRHFLINLPIQKLYEDKDFTIKLLSRKTNTLNLTIIYTDKEKINRKAVYSCEILKEIDSLSRHKVKITEISPAILRVFSNDH